MVSRGVEVGFFCWFVCFAGHLLELVVVFGYITCCMGVCLSEQENFFFVVESVSGA